MRLTPSGKATVWVHVERASTMNPRLLATALSIAAVTAPYLENERRERQALISLAWQMRKNAALYRTWAKEAERDGNLEQYRRYAPMARQAFRDARFHLEQARMRHA